MSFLGKLDPGTFQNGEMSTTEGAGSPPPPGECRLAFHPQSAKAGDAERTRFALMASIAAEMPQLQQVDREQHHVKDGRRGHVFIAHELGATMAQIVRLQQNLTGELDTLDGDEAVRVRESLDTANTLVKPLWLRVQVAQLHSILGEAPSPDAPEADDPEYDENCLMIRPGPAAPDEVFIIN